MQEEQKEEEEQEEDEEQEEEEEQEDEEPLEFYNIQQKGGKPFMCQFRQRRCGVGADGIRGFNLFIYLFQEKLNRGGGKDAKGSMQKNRAVGIRALLFFVSFTSCCGETVKI